MANVIAGSGCHFRVATRRVRAGVGALICIAALAANAAERFDDIVVSPHVFYQGQTFHGYVEMRFAVENTSAERTRKVTLATPHQAHSWGGHTLRRVERTVTVSPGATVNVTLWQPPLVMNGDNQVDVSVDGRYRGAIPRGGNNQHMQRHAHSGIPGGPRAVLVSRSLNSDDLDKAFRGGITFKGPTGNYSAEQATGAPNVPARSGGMNPYAWTPDRVGMVGPEWLELDYKPARSGVKTLRIHKLGWDQAFKTVVLKAADGTDLATVMVTNNASRNFTLSVLELPLPALTNAIATVRLNVDSGRAGGQVSVDAVELSDGSTSTYATDARASSTYATRMSHSPSSTTYQGPMVLRSELEASGWSESWLAFTAFDLVVLSRVDLAAMNAAQQNALRSYVEAGGGLMVLGLTELPKGWASGAIAQPKFEAMNRFPIGFGKLLGIEAGAIGSMSRAQVDALKELARECGQIWHSMPNEGNANSEFPVIEDARIPVRGIVFIMLAFILVVGPVNIFLCARANNRIAMLWTIPLISFITCAVVFGYSLMSEGITPTTRTEAVTFLDQAAHRATTLARQAFYTPLTPGDGLRYSHDTEVTPLVDVNRYNGGSSRELELSQSQHLIRGWITARVPAHFALRKSETRRERLQVQRLPDGRVTVLNGLGADIQTLWFRDDKGRLFKGEGLKAGQNTALTPDPDGIPSTDAAMNNLTGLYQGSWVAASDALVGSRNAYLAPRTYLAVMATAPFIETGLAKPGKVRARQTIIGVLAPEDVK